MVCKQIGLAITRITLQIVRAAITRCSCVFNALQSVLVHLVLHAALVHKRKLCSVMNATRSFGFLDSNFYFQEGCNYSNDINKVMSFFFLSDIIFDIINYTDKMKIEHNSKQE